MEILKKQVKEASDRCELKEAMVETLKKEIAKKDQLE